MASHPARFLNKPADILYSRALGWGLTRTTMLAEGAERCDFRFRQGAETQVAVPEPLAQYLRFPGEYGIIRQP